MPSLAIPAKPDVRNSGTHEIGDTVREIPKFGDTGKFGEIRGHSTGNSGNSGTKFGKFGDTGNSRNSGTQYAIRAVSTEESRRCPIDAG
jgi:hypothetical protein